MRRACNGILVVLLITLFGCNSSEKKSKKDIIKANIEKKEAYSGYIVTLNAIIRENDEFLINFISEYEFDDKFVIKNVIKASVKGSDVVQSVEFKLPEDVLDLRRLRINFGKNRKQQKIQFKNITIAKEGRKLVLDINQIERYFIPNSYLDIDNKLSIITLKENKGRYNPFILSKWSISSPIKKALID